MIDMVEFPASEWNGYSPSLFLKALSDSHLPNADLVVRESIQNSYDARVDEDVPVDFKIKGFYLNEQQKKFFSGVLPTQSSKTAEMLDRNLNRDNVYCLEIRDSNSKGLNGPYQRYDEITRQEIHSTENNYRDFVWNMGGSKDRTKGGSFGVGKTSLFLISRVKTICIYSKTIYNNTYQSRFIIKSFYPYLFNDAKINQYWFSKARSNPNSLNREIPLPFLGVEADVIARSIGMKVYEPGETGTDILILDVDFNTEEEENIDPRKFFCEKFPNSIQNWFWTKLSDECELKKKINISIWDDQRELELIKPNNPYSQYFSFFRCLSIWKEEYSKIEYLGEKEKIAYIKNPHFIPIHTVRPAVMLGAVTYVKVEKNSKLMGTFFTNGDYNLCLARMRDVEFCMQYQYFKFPQIEKDQVVFALFHTDPRSWDGGVKDNYPGAVDAAFRKAENKTHDEWVVESVQDRDKTYVKQGAIKIRSALEERFDSKDNVISTQDVSGSLSLAMGKFLPYGAGFGASRALGSVVAKPERKGKKTYSFPPFKMMGVPLFYGNGWRRIKCSLTIKETIPMRGHVYPIVGTVEGSAIKALAAEKRVVIKSVTFGQNEQNQTESIAFGNNTIPLNRVGCFVFVLDVFGDIGFDLKIELV